MQSSFLLDVVVRLCPVIVHSICIPNSCIFLTAKTCVLRCCLYRRGHGWFIVRMRLWDPPAWSHSYRHNRRGTCASPTTRTDLVMHPRHNVSTELAHLDTSFPQRPDAGRSNPPKLEPPSEKWMVGSARSRNPPERGSSQEQRLWRTRVGCLTHLTPRQPHAEFLHCTQHDLLTSGYSMKGVVSTGLLRNGGGQSRNVHRAARGVASSILLPALQPPSSLLDCIRDEILPQSGFLRWLISWWETTSAGRRDTSASNSETVVVVGTGGSDIGLLLLPPPNKQDVLGLPPTLHFRQLFRLPTGATLLGTFDGYLRHELPLPSPPSPLLSPPPLLPSSLSLSPSLSPLLPLPLSLLPPS